MRNSLPVPSSSDPILAINSLVGSARARQLLSEDHTTTIALIRLSDQIEKHDDGHGRVHLLWTGPVRPDTGIPIVFRWKGKQRVPVHRVLWEAQYGEEPVGYPRRLDECAYPMCVSPRCFTVATPVEPANLPETMTRGQRTDVDGNPIKDYKVAAAPFFSDRYYLKFGKGLELLKLHNAEGAEFVVPTCPNGHPIYSRLYDWHEHQGEQYRCDRCTTLRRMCQEIRGWQPRSGFKPLSAAAVNRARETQQWLDSMPHANTPEDAHEDARIARMTDAEFLQVVLNEFEDGSRSNEIAQDAKFQQDLRDAREHPELFDAETLEYLLSVQPDE